MAELGLMLSLAKLQSGFEPVGMKRILDTLQQDVGYAAGSGVQLIEPSTLAHTLLGNMIARGATSQSVAPAPVITLTPGSNIEAKCGGVEKKECREGRAEISSRLLRATTYAEQLQLLELAKNENRFFKRLWDKKVGATTTDQITVGALCGSCLGYYRQKICTALYCFKEHCGGDLELFRSTNATNGRIALGKIVFSQFDRSCTHGEFVGVGAQVVV